MAALREEGRIVAEKRPYLHAVGHCSRCDTVVEPRLSLQWFVKVGPLAKAAGDAVRDGRVRIVPTGAGAALLRLGRQHARLVHQSPAVVGPPHPGLVRTRRQRAGRASARTRGAAGQAGSRTRTSSTPGSPPGCGRSRPSAGRTSTADLRKFYPTTVLVTGYDIMFFWVARMMMFGLYAMDGRQPFNDGRAARSGARQVSARRCRKSRGNGIDPLRVDRRVRRRRGPAARWRRAPNPGADLAINEEWVKGGRNFCTKLWNATRFALLNGADGRRARCRPTADRRRPLDPVAAGSRCTPRSTRCTRSTSSPGPATRSTTSPGTRCATGTSSWPSCRWPGRGADVDPPRARPGARRAAAAAAPGGPVRHRDAVDQLTGGESVVDRGLAGARREADRPRGARRGSRACRPS